MIQLDAHHSEFRNQFVSSQQNVLRVFPQISHQINELLKLESTTCSCPYTTLPGKEGHRSERQEVCQAGQDTCKEFHSPTSLWG
jgi:hypothetical protein